MADYKKLAKQRDGFRCTNCGTKGKRRNRLQVHHVIPRCHNGGNNLSNLKTLCAKCHRALHMREGYPKPRR